MKILLQINISNDGAKSGFLADELPPLLEQFGESYPHIDLLGGMTITRLYEHAEESREDYAKMYGLMKRLSEQFPEVFPENGPEISMGMSSDFEVAIEEGATMVRIGSALFGPRP